MLRKLSLFVVSAVLLAACQTQPHNPSQTKPVAKPTGMQICKFRPEALPCSTIRCVVTIAQGVRYKPMATRAAPALVPKYTALRRANAMAAPVNNL